MKAKAKKKSIGKKGKKSVRPEMTKKMKNKMGFKY